MLCVRQSYAHIFHKLDVAEHDEVIEDIVHTSVCALGLVDQSVHLLLNLVGTLKNLVREFLQVVQHLKDTIQKRYNESIKHVFLG